MGRRIGGESGGEYEMVGGWRMRGLGRGGESGAGRRNEFRIGRFWRSGDLNAEGAEKKCNTAAGLGFIDRA